MNISINFNNKEEEMLKRYAQIKGISLADCIKNIIKEKFMLNSDDIEVEIMDK